jgi:hypothetical protein
VTGVQTCALPISDLQSLADLGGAVDALRAMRWAPVGKRLLTATAAAALAPMAPLLLFKFPLADLLRMIVGKIAGL